MKTAFPAVLLFLFGTTLAALPQTPAVTHNTWSPGAPMPIAAGPAVAVLKGQIYVIGGGAPTGNSADTQIYDPATDSWTTGGSLPVAVSGGCAAVVNNALYYIGGSAPSGSGWTGTVWIYDAKTQSWSEGSQPMPTGGVNGWCAVANKLIYVGGGYNADEGGFLTTVWSYNPATDTWAPEPPMLYPEAGRPAVGTIILKGTPWIVVTDGSGGYPDGRNQGYDVTTNAWSWLASDPTLRQAPCAAPIGGRLYSAGGYAYDTTFNVTESYSLSQNAWNKPSKPLASMLLGTNSGGSVAYKGQLYCFGGFSSSTSGSSLINNVQIYQP